MPPSHLIRGLGLLALLLGAVWCSAASAGGLSRLQRQTDLIEGTVESIDVEHRMFVLRDRAGAPHAIRYGSHTVVFTEGSDRQAATVSEGDRAVVRCVRKIVDERKEGGVCRIEYIADQVYIDDAVALNAQ